MLPDVLRGRIEHVAVRFSRLNREVRTLSSYEAVYLVTNRDGHVGIQARSSFAPYTRHRVSVH